MPTISPQTTPYYGGGQVVNPANVIRTPGVPSNRLTEDSIGTIAIDNSVGSAYILVSKSGGINTWVPIVGAASYPITPYVVGSSGEAGYQTIQSAINAANTAGGGIVYIQPGNYTEDLSLRAGVSLVGTPSNFESGSGSPGNLVVINGTHVPPSSGACSFSNIFFADDTAILSSATAGTATINFYNCYFNVTSGYSINLLNWVGAITLFNVTTLGLNDDGIFRNQGGASLSANSCFFYSQTNELECSGTIYFMNSLFSCPVKFSGTALIYCTGCSFLDGATVFGSSSGKFVFCNFAGSPAFTFTTLETVYVSNSNFDTASGDAIGGGSVTFLHLADVSFSQSNDIDTDVDIIWGSSRTGTMTSTNLSIEEVATSPTMGTTVLSSGSQTVNTTAVTANSRIFLSYQALGSIAFAESLAVTSRVPGTSFTISSSAGTDTSIVAWLLIEPA